MKRVLNVIFIMLCALLPFVLVGCTIDLTSFYNNCKNNKSIIVAFIFVIATFALIIFIIYNWRKRHIDFIKKAKSIKKEMTIDEVLRIMGCSATTAEEEGNRLTSIWEKNQWKGIFHGGTLTRSIKVICIDGRVVNTVGKNLDKSVFW